MFDLNELTLEEVNAEYDRTLDKLERLSKLREAILEQDHRRIAKLIVEYHITQAKRRDINIIAEDRG